MTDPSEPTTAAGRRLLAELQPWAARFPDKFLEDWEVAILAIEAEARQPDSDPPAQDVERLARAISAAMAAVPWPGKAGRITFGGMTYNAAAHAIAAEYARLSAQPEAQPAEEADAE